MHFKQTIASLGLGCLITLGVHAGSSDQVIPIRTADDLEKMNQNLSGHYQLENNIDLAGRVFYPIGNMEAPFTGTLDGQGYSIENLTIDQHKAMYVGLFSVIGKSGQVTHLNILNADVWGWNTTGILAAFNQGNIDNVLVEGTVRGYNNVGGLVGGNDGGNISNSGAVVSVTGNSNFVGGLVGGNSEGNITHSYSLAQVSSARSHVGGLMGDNFEGVVSQSYAKGSVSGVDNVGGLTGGNDHGTLINDAAMVRVTSQNGTFVGGLSGDNIEQGKIENCYENGAVLSQGNPSLYRVEHFGNGPNQVGGLVGYNAGEVQYAYWDIDTSRQKTSSGGIGETDEAMRHQATYVGWDFDHIWRMVVYPELQ